VTDIESIWRSQPANYIKSCCFEKLINQETSMKDSVFILLQKYLEGRVYGVDSLIKNPQAVQKYTLYVNNKKKCQTSFISKNDSSPFASAADARQLKL
jgi:hypothetical protein